MGQATYNWSIKGGSVVSGFNGTSQTVAASADDVKPANAMYIATWGDDLKGNGSRKYPFRTFAKFVATTQVTIVGGGTYRFSGTTTITINNGCYLVGDGNTIIDGYTVTVTVSTSGGGNVKNIKFRNLNMGGVANHACEFFNVNFGILGSCYNCLLVSCTTGQGALNVEYLGNTYVRSFVSMLNPILIRKQRNIFYQCNIEIPDNTNNTVVDFMLFYQCNFRCSINGGPITTIYYPSIPAGYIQPASMESLRTYADGVFLGALKPQFPNCTMADPKFNNIAIGDYTLAYDSPAKNRSYLGTYVGAFSIATSLRIRGDAALSGMDNDTAVNLLLADDSATLIDTNVIASIQSKPVSNLPGREIVRLPTFGYNADRNGEYIDATTDLDTTVIAAGTDLSAITPYFIETGAITYNGQIYQPGDRFTSLTAPGTFTTLSGGTVREILEAPTRENVQARFTDGAAGYTASGSIALNTWYFVENNPITYNGTVYPTGTFFRGTATTTFTGAGSARLIFAAADPFYFFEINQKPTSNNAGNLRSGDIVQGNGHKDFDRTPANIFAINKKFIQVKYTIQVNNLRP